MRTILIATIAFTSLQPGLISAQSEALFPGAEKLDTCLVELPLTYAKKDIERYTQAARYLENEELIYLTYNKKDNSVSYSRVFVVVQTANDGKDFVYVESTEDHMRMGGAKQAFFPKFTPSKERFYNATCFDAQLAQHPELAEKLKQSTLGDR